MKRQSRALKMAALEEEMAREAGTGFSLRRSSVSGVQGSEGIELEANIDKDICRTEWTTRVSTDYWSLGWGDVCCGYLRSTSM